MKKLTTGRRMFWSVFIIFIVYAIVFFVFEDFERRVIKHLPAETDWHLIWFSLVVLGLLGFILLRYSRRMDERIDQQQTKEQNRMRRQLTQNVAHELKTPVASIRGYMETLLENPQLDEETRNQFIIRSHAQTERLAALLTDIVTLSRMDYAPGSHHHKSVDITQMVCDMVLELQLQFEQHRQTFHNLLPEEITVDGDPSLLYSVFRNLADNAIEYSGENTTITLTAHRENNEWHFTFRDNGPGVPDKHLPRLFERFYRIDKGRSRSLGGTGLGLAIVKNAITLHGGTISVSNALGGGLRFDFTIPVSI